ncbi:hypothetical protein EDB92DRAFT_1897047 [Lactarius akahatsu]|uniref:Uncharacterized protein n=1 Tax=Lactarius akahatsu TaxID=416441 RepID=A0AAD4L5W3_9AGAM|nr:hypothetical protein EDB92DRAFT_1897047 [Lactarius akahatsu]
MLSPQTVSTNGNRFQAHHPQYKFFVPAPRRLHTLGRYSRTTTSRGDAIPADTGRAPQADVLLCTRAQCKGSRSDKLPPQTVLVQVLRELEDDFTHYKGIHLY